MISTAVANLSVAIDLILGMEGSVPVPIRGLKWRLSSTTAPPMNCSGKFFTEIAAGWIWGRKSSEHTVPPSLLYWLDGIQIGRDGQRSSENFIKGAWTWNSIQKVLCKNSFFAMWLCFWTSASTTSSGHICWPPQDRNPDPVDLSREINDITVQYRLRYTEIRWLAWMGRKHFLCRTVYAATADVGGWPRGALRTTLEKGEGAVQCREVSEHHSINY